jgi:pimeloyl-ACP methyl ester carboxylesterase
MLAALLLVGRAVGSAIVGRKGTVMPQIVVDGLAINYEVQGEGEPLLLIPYLSADHACYAFQLPAYTEHFSCVAVDLPGTGESDKPVGPYSTEVYADQVAAFLGAIGVEQAHVAGVSLGAGVGMHLAARHPGRVRSLSLHSAWDTSDLYLKTIVELWRSMAHDVSPVLGEIGVPSLITVGARDLVCSPRFAERINSKIGGSELVVFEHLSHGGLHEDPESFNRATLDFLRRQRSYRPRRPRSRSRSPGRRRPRRRVRGRRSGGVAFVSAGAPPRSAPQDRSRARA